MDTSKKSVDKKLIMRYNDYRKQEKGEKNMEYKYNGKVYEVPNDVVDKMMETLDCSMADACETWLADNDLITNDEQVALDKEAKSGKRHYEKSDKVRKKAKKERKVDEEKGFLLEIMRKSLENEAKIDDIWVKTETELNFTYNGNKFTVKLTKHRPKKA